MDEADLTLRDLWAETEAPARDPRFVLEVMAKVERRRLWLGVAALAPVTAGVAAAAWALAPVLVQVASGTVGSVGGASMTGLAVALTLAGLLMSRRPQAA